PLSRLVKVELRKLADTRAGLWLLIAVLAISVAATVIVILVAGDAQMTHQTFITAIGSPLSVLLPVVAILSVTSEWSQRTGLVTFTLEPRRGRTVVAKLLAVLLTGLVTIVIAIGLAAVATVVGAAVNGVDPTWNLGFDGAAGWLLVQVLGLLCAFAFATVLRNSAAAIVIYYAYIFVVSSLFGALAAFQQWFSDIWPWVELNRAQTPLFDASMTGENWAQLATASAIWIVLPMVVGVWTLLRSEVK
ncbi:ABC transporter permease, partial [Solicola sp. PLA-1-18]|uniref:ABC transporter permease n=1 Tax=Solicola sp. PLA-1-18 TaxID=3380532 RepID=UPI003B7979C5